MVVLTRDAQDPEDSRVTFECRQVWELTKKGDGRELHKSKTLESDMTNGRE